MSSLMDYLLAQPSLLERFVSLQGILGQPGMQNGSSPPPVTGNRGSSVGLGPTGGDNWGPTDPLTSFKTVTLAEPALRSLMSIAQQYRGPGMGELNRWGDLASYRTYAEQAGLGGTQQNPGGSNPNATWAGNSMHEKGIAIDVPGWLQTAAFFDLLRKAGWNQLASEDWHWTYKDYG